MEFEYRKMRHDYDKGQKRNSRRNRTAKSGKNQNAWRKEKLQVFGNIRSKHHQTSGNDRKNNKSVPQTDEKTSQNQTLQQKSHQRDKHLGYPTCKILRTILKIEKGGQGNW